MTRRRDLDGIRGLAILFVVVGHLDQARLGAWVGVQLFFVLSGYLITGLLVREHSTTGRVDILAFYGRRARRLLPALALLLAVVTVAGISLAYVVPVVFYGANWVRASGNTLGPLSHLWSLSIEEQFYFVWPLLALPLVRRRGLLVGLIVASACLRLVVAPEMAYFGTLTRLDALLIGALLAVAQVRLPRWSGNAALLVLLALFLVTSGGLDVVTVAMAVATLAAAVAVADPPGWVASRPLAWFGAISYALYLWHYPFLVVFGPVGLLLSIPAAWASTRYLEGPIRRLGRREVREAGLRMRPERIGPGVVELPAVRPVDHG